MKKLQKDLLLLALMTVYTMVAGCPDSLLRALSLLAAFIVISALHVRETLTGALFMAGLIVLSIEYRLLFSWGFQLSFLAVAGIALVAVPIKKRAESRQFWSRMSGPARLLAITAIITVSVQLFMLPLVLEMFGRTPLLATVINMIMTVPVTVEMVLGFVYMILPFDWLKHLLSLPVNLVSHFMYSAPTAMMELGIPGIYRGQVWYPAYICGMIIFCSVLKKNHGRPGGRMIMVAVLIGLSFLQCVPFPLKTKLPGPSTDGTHWKGIELHEGDAIVLIVERGIGIYQARRIVKDLWAAGLGSIDYIIVLSTDVDQLKGLPFITTRMRPRATICSPYIRMDIARMPGYTGTRFKRVELRTGDCEIRMGDYSISVRQPVFPPEKGKIVSFKDSGLRIDIIKHKL